MSGVLRLTICAAFAVALVGCFEDRFECTTDAQCDLGVGGRCESTGFCTSFDVSCPTNHRYATHAGELTDACYDDSTQLPNLCAGGQGPASREGCLATVCERLPACCDIGWSDACVQVAQEQCERACDTRIAVAAIRGAVTELWDARWDGTEWTFMTMAGNLGPPLSWVAPAPGTVEPRLAGTTAASIVVGDLAIEVPMGRSYDAITAVSFDREQVDTIAAGYTNAQDQEFVEVRRLDDLTVREMRLSASELLTWGDVNRDGFPDGVVKDANGYSYVENAAEGFTRKLTNPTNANVTGGVTPGAPGLRSIDWLDFNADGRLDLAVFGNSVRIHATFDGLRDSPEHELDCSPPSKARACDADPEPDLEGFSFVGAALPTLEKPSIVFAQYPDRKLWLAYMNGTMFVVDQLSFPGDNCRCIEQCNNNTCPGANCTCNYDCASCVPILAIVSRDLDGDQLLDLVAIDAKLRVYNAFAANDFAWGNATQIPTAETTSFTTVNVSVSGAPR